MTEQALAGLHETSMMFLNLSAEEASNVAIKKAVMSREAKAIEPGKYTVILEPAASIGLIQNMFGSFNARTADEGRSFMSKEGGGTKLGEKIVDERINMLVRPFTPRSTRSNMERTRTAT